MYNFEMDIKTRARLQRSDIFSVFDRLKCKINCIKTAIDDKFAATTDISVSDFLNTEYAGENDYAIFQASRNGIPCGMIISKNNDGFLYSLWFKCDDSSEMDAVCIDESNTDKYLKAIDFAYESFCPFSIVYASFGCEMRISDEVNLLQKIEKSTALAWLVPNISLDKTPSRYVVRQYHGQYSVILKKE